MKSKESYYKVGFISLIFIIGLIDLYFALKNPFLESNPGLVILKNYFGGFQAWFWIVSLKFFFIFLSSILLLYHKYRSEAQFFFVITLFTLLLLTTGYGTYTGYRANMSVSAIEEEYGPLDSPTKQIIEAEGKKLALSIWRPNIFMLGILPLLMANLAFFIFRKLRSGVVYGK